MPRSQFISPTDVRQAGAIRFNDIPVCQYNKSIEEEKENYTTEDFLNIWHDMRLIREFEEMLLSVKTHSQYRGHEYSNPGPAHLSIGQEASAVGQAYLLDENDYIFGSHRSHGEVIAKACSAIRKMPDDKLKNIMKSYMDGRIFDIVQTSLGENDSVKDIAIRFFIYGILAEIFAKETGFNKGLGGSMHVFSLPFGIFPNNAIVGGSADIALGAALYKKINREKGIVIANIGDGSLGCGPVWEAFQMSVMDQYEQLWEGDMRGGLPLVFNIMNNQYAMGGQTRGETMGYEFPARSGAGLNTYNMHAERVDGYNPLAVIDAISRKRDILCEKKGPVLLETLTYRFAGHSPSDADSYRTKDEKDAWQNVDSIVTFANSLIEAGITTQEELDAIETRVIDVIERAMVLAIDPVVSPRMDLAKVPDQIESVMFSNLHVPKCREGKPDVLQEDRQDNPRVKQIARRERYAFDADGKRHSANRVYQLRDAIFEAILDKFYEDPSLVAWGEENRDWGGAFGVYRGLTEAIPYHRLFNSPISEGAIVGAGVGYGMAGGRAIVELMYCDFLGRAGDEVFNQLPKWQAMSGGLLQMPVVVRVSVGNKYGAQHSQDWTSLCTHIPGLKVVFPATPYDAKGLMTAALNGSDPVIFFESQRLYGVGEEFVRSGVPETPYEVPFGEPAVRRVGTDVTILTIGATLYRALEAAEMMSSQYGIEAEVIDARSLVPFNYDMVLESVAKTGKIIIASDACERGSYLNDLARNITNLAFDDLDAPPVVIGSRNWITPPIELDEFFTPQATWFIDAYHQRIAPIPGYVSVFNFTNVELLRRSKIVV
jgi:2-oxoisovalerate dehydrogenase E1 component